MRNPEDKYRHDPQYAHLVKIFEGLIQRAEFTPSEIHEAAMYAGIRYEMRHPFARIVIENGQEICKNERKHTEKTFQEAMNHNLSVHGSAVLSIKSDGTARIIEPHELYQN